MKLRHAAALALVGWYLMLPPVSNGLDSKTSMPLYLWTQFEAKSFSTLAECEARKASYKQENLDDAKEGSKQQNVFLKISENADKGRCVKSDDPGLARPSPKPIPGPQTKPLHVSKDTTPPQTD
ncbi:MAG TPA: hypothetical protein VJX23_11280 [Candidatus Binataceae bacterium]|nr:hypothetical protein [Candidatus Binataceae bacterium]